MKNKKKTTKKAKNKKRPQKLVNSATSKTIDGFSKCKIETFSSNDKTNCLDLESLNSFNIKERLKKLDEAIAEERKKEQNKATIWNKLKNLFKR